MIFLDEPTTGLDPAKREDMWEVVRRLVTDGSTVLLTTQYLDEADALADEITVIDHGRVIAHDTPDGLKQIVGGQTLEVRPTDPSRTAEATAILAEITGGRVESPRRGTLSVSVPDDSALPTTAARLASAGITVTEFSLHLPSLDEVFFTLTGRSASDDESQSDTYPYMEINEQDARIGHEATVSKVGEDQLFYLMSRGLAEDEAMATIVRGFVEPIARELPMEYALELNRLIELQMEGSVG